MNCGWAASRDKKIVENPNDTESWWYPSSASLGLSMGENILAMPRQDLTSVKFPWKMFLPDILPTHTATYLLVNIRIWNEGHWNHSWLVTLEYRRWQKIISLLWHFCHAYNFCSPWHFPCWVIAPLVNSAPPESKMVNTKLDWNPTKSQAFLTSTTFKLSVPFVPEFQHDRFPNLDPR